MQPGACRVRRPRHPQVGRHPPSRAASAERHRAPCRAPGPGAGGRRASHRVAVIRARRGASPGLSPSGGDRRSWRRGAGCGRALAHARREGGSRRVGWERRMSQTQSVRPQLLDHRVAGQGAGSVSQTVSSPSPVGRGRQRQVHAGRVARERLVVDVFRTRRGRRFAGRCRPPPCPPLTARPRGNRHGQLPRQRTGRRRPRLLEKDVPLSASLTPRWRNSSTALRLARGSRATDAHRAGLAETAQLPAGSFDFLLVSCAAAGCRRCRSRPSAPPACDFRKVLQVSAAADGSLQRPRERPPPPPWEQHRRAHSRSQEASKAAIRHLGASVVDQRRAKPRQRRPPADEPGGSGRRGHVSGKNRRVLRRCAAMHRLPDQHGERIARLPKCCAAPAKADSTKTLRSSARLASPAHSAAPASASGLISTRSCLRLARQAAEAPHRACRDGACRDGARRNLARPW